MGRSVLPSTARKGAREEIRAAHSEARQRQAQLLDAVASAACLCDDPDAVDCPLCDADLPFTNPQRKVKYAVRDRRGADKVAPLIRWADAQIPEGTYPDEAYVMMKAMLPPGLIGDHAMTHLDDVLPERNPFEHLWLTSARTVIVNEFGELEQVWRSDLTSTAGGWAARRYDSHWDRSHSRKRSLAEWVIGEGWLGEFNKLGAVGHKPLASDYLYIGEIPGRPRRALLGAHDIDDWVKAYGNIPDDIVEWAVERGWKDPAAN